MSVAWHRRIVPSRVSAALALATGLALRLFFVLRYPTETCDSAVYEELARNWLQYHVYGLFFPGGLAPSDLRGPGYPAWVALLYPLFGRSREAILLSQVALDMCTCVLVAWLASLLVLTRDRSRIGLAALWLAATCPLVANYTAVPLTEVLATFLTAAALVALVKGCSEADHGGPGQARLGWRWFAGGFFVGLGTLVRPETPLVLVAFALVLVWRWRRRADWGRLVRAGVFSALGLLLPLAPWAARNWVSLHEVQFLSPRYAATPDEYVPRGMYAWTGTWLVRFHDVYQVPWKIGGERVEMGDLPPSAFDSAAERLRVAALLAAYNETTTMTPGMDQGFAELAKERTRRHPLRTYLLVPIERAATMWFTPRVELLPLAGTVTPLTQSWREDPVDFSVTVFFMALNFFYVGLACWGVRRALQHKEERAYFSTALALLLAFLLIRTAALTFVETPEPRYLLECFPALLALGALGWLPKQAPK